MDSNDKEIMQKFKNLLNRRKGLVRLTLFGSRARGESSPFSDMDVLVVWDNDLDEQTRNFISDCAWEAGFDSGIVIVPVVFTREEWENGPERSSLLAQAVIREGLVI